QSLAAGDAGRQPLARGRAGIPGVDLGDWEPGYWSGAAGPRRRAGRGAAARSAGPAARLQRARDAAAVDCLRLATETQLRRVAGEGFPPRPGAALARDHEPSPDGALLGR